VSADETTVTDTHRRAALLRVRASYIALAIVTIAVGLAVHWHGASLGPVLRDILGDALWAAMMFWFVSALIPGVGLVARGVVVLCICFAVEAGQRIDSPGLDALRNSTIGHLVLGSGFDPRDFVSYSVGVLAAMLIAFGVARHGGRDGTPSAERPSRR
jgi:hypothetical protein